MLLVFPTKLYDGDVERADVGPNPGAYVRAERAKSWNGLGTGTGAVAGDSD